jgi:hypothetical protein
MDAMALDDMHPSEVGGAGARAGAARPLRVCDAPPRAGVPQNPTRDSGVAGLVRSTLLVGLKLRVALLEAGDLQLRATLEATEPR